MAMYDSAVDKIPFGASAAGAENLFTLRLPKSGGLSSPRLILHAVDQWSDTAAVIPMEFVAAEPSCNRYLARYTPPRAGLFYYCFEADGPEGRPMAIRRGRGTRCAADDEFGELWQLTVYDGAFQTPDFIRGGLYYQIFPDRFCRSGAPKEGVPSDRSFHGEWGGLPVCEPNSLGEITNSDYYGGDLPGITEKLDYLRGLGVTCLYLNPIFEAHSNHRYNTADYKKVDPLLGTEEDFRALCREAHRRGMAVVLDGVFSHTGSDSVYFNREGRYPAVGAYNSRQSPYYPWYDFFSYPNGYACWWNFDTLPNVRETEPSYLEFICGEQGVLRHWMDLGADGFRLDVADELPDEFLDAVTACVKAYDPQKLIIGEVWEDASSKVSYGQRRRYLLGGQLDAVMNYPFRDAVLDFVRNGSGDALYARVLSILENYPPQVVSCLMNCLSTHDVERAITALAAEPLDGRDRYFQAARHFLPVELYQRGRALLKMAYAILYFLPGVPCLYYGDEAGLSGYRDPFNRCPYPWGSEDGELLQFFRAIGNIRAQSRVLTDGAFTAVQVSSSVFSFLRQKDGEGLFVAVNRSGWPQALLLPGQMGNILYGSLSGGRLEPSGILIAALNPQPPSCEGK
ncbi:MAG: glycoside hydrolase family 13 protein [Oscillospiraceae bacterium]|nr:glycoside hydrolase family 13 protein [Oscillospiraceae bacterium]